MNLDKTQTVMNDVIVMQNALFCYGLENKAHIKLNYGQQWKVISLPCGPFPWYTIERQNVILDVLPEDFMTIFQEKK